MGLLPKLLLWAGLLASTHATLAANEGGIVKWVDDKGVTHYGDAIPPEYANRSNAVLNRSGRVVQKNEAFKSSVTPSPDAEQERLLTQQKRRDSVLLASYTTAQEIDLARERSTQMDEAAIKGLEQRAAGVRERLAAHEKTASGFSRRKTPVPPDLLQDINATKGELGRINAQIAQKRKDIEDTRIRFDRDKQRFHELKQAQGALPR